MTDKRDDASDPQPSDGGATAPSPFDQNTEEIPAKGASPQGEADAGPATEAMPGLAWSNSAARSHSDSGDETQPVPTQSQYSSQVTRGRPPRPSATAGYKPLVDDDDLGLGESEATEQIPVQDTAPPEAYSSAHTEILQRPDEQAFGSYSSGTGAHSVQQPSAGADQWGAGGGADQWSTGGGADQWSTAGGADQWSTAGGADQWGAAAAGGAGAGAASYGAQPEAHREPMAVAPAHPVREGRGTLEFGLLVLRVLVGGALIADGIRHLLGQAGGLGMSGLETLFADAGYQSPGIVAIAVMSAQIGGGLLLLLGLATPVGAAVAVAALINVWLAQQSAEPGLQGVGTPELEVAFLLGMAAAALALTGPGRFSLERSAGWSTRPRWGSSVLLVLGIVGGVCAWIFLSGQV